jgi:large subunit ribosomal protein L10
MAVNRKRKEAIVASLQQKVSTAKAIYLVDFAKLNTKREFEIRRKLKQAQAEYLVVKNTLLSRALAEAKMPTPGNGSLTGNTALILTYTDPLSPLKTINKIIKEGDGVPALKSAFLEGRFFLKGDLKPLERFNSKAEVIAETIGAVQGILVSLISVLSAIPATTVGTLEAICEKKTSGGAS